ncbi:hypothetical protein SAMN05428969_1203 [Devosia sp. YR412]|uniref:hypothetical protein n=1 Tax=Devosia sp. YR412 TaxID=1881030 RepID=UPI0008AD6D60|nr:hypothetical protein [Devosia sp. YR412]SEP85396.1 hypothetical protein SAMN05428969_1203 [Devosia sp. YR412]
MRILALLLFALITIPALAQDWRAYDNARFGYSVEIPPGFRSLGESESGDGQGFINTRTPIELLVWGGNLAGDFETEVAQRMAWSEADAWNITYQAVTPRWASYSAVKGSRVLYERLVLLCDDTSYAAFRAEYSVTETADMNQPIERMVQSLRGNGC